MNNYFITLLCASFFLVSIYSMEKESVWTNKWAIYNADAAKAAGHPIFPDYMYSEAAKEVFASYLSEPDVNHIYEKNLKPYIVQRKHEIISGKQIPVLASGNLSVIQHYAHFDKQLISFYNKTFINYVLCTAVCVTTHTVLEDYLNNPLWPTHFKKIVAGLKQTTPTELPEKVSEYYHKRYYPSPYHHALLAEELACHKAFLQLMEPSLTVPEISTPKKVSPSIQRKAFKQD